MDRKLFIRCVKTAFKFFYKDADAQNMYEYAEDVCNSLAGYADEIVTDDVIEFVGDITGAKTVTAEEICYIANAHAIFIAGLIRKMGIAEDIREYAQQELQWDDEMWDSAYTQKLDADYEDPLLFEVRFSK